MKRWSTPVGNGRRLVSEVPCRVSSDAHEPRNHWSSVSRTDSVKLKSR